MLPLHLLKYEGVTTDQIDLPMVQDIAESFGYAMPADKAIVGHVVSLLRENDVNGLADIVGKPQVLVKLKELFAGPEQDENLIVCPHCGEYINPQA